MCLGSGCWVAFLWLLLASALRPLRGESSAPEETVSLLCFVIAGLPLGQLGV